MTLPILYTRDAKQNPLFWKIWTEGPEVVTEHGQVGGAVQQARFTCTGKNLGRANETTPEQQAEREAKAKWEKQAKRKYSESLDAATKLLPMLASKFDPKKVDYPVYVQPKFDGVRCLAYVEDGSVVLHSRNGETYDVEHIRGELDLPDGLVLDGELYCHGMSLQQIVSLVKRPQPDSVLLRYHVYDIGNTKADQAERLVILEHLPLPLDCDQVPTAVALDATEVQYLHDRYVRDGYEGAIIRRMGGMYRFGYRSPDLMKLKNFESSEFLIIGYRRGKGAFYNAPIFRCMTDDAKEFDVAPKGTSEMRAQMLQDADSYIEHPLTVRYFGWTDEGLPRFPVGVCVRPKEDM